MTITFSPFLVTADDGFIYCVMKVEDWNWWRMKRAIPIEMSDFIALDEIEPVFLTTFLSTCR